MSDNQKWSILQGDALKVLGTFTPNTFDAVITDPPYASGGRTQAEKNKSTARKYSSMGENAPPPFDGDAKDQRSWTRWAAEWLYEARKVCKSGAPVMNHRSAPRLVALQKAMYESLKEKATEVCASGNWAEDDGNIALFIADNEQLEAAAVSKDILLKISNGVEPHDICILCKQKPQDYASAIIEELEKHGVRARIETGYQDLIKEPIVDLFIKFMICADSRKHPNEWTFIEELLVELWGISGMRENDTFDEMQRKLSAVVNVVKKNIQQKLDTEQWHSTLNSIIDFFGIGNIKAKFPAYKQGTYFMNVINQFESLFFEEYVAAHGVWNLAIENFRGDHSVPIMTIHKSKGLEYNAVYFIGLEDSAFWNFRNQPDEDRCTFFVALSRAKASVTFTFCKKRTGMKCPMQRHNAINEFFDLLQRPGIAEVKRFQNR